MKKKFVVSDDEYREALSNLEAIAQEKEKLEYLSSTGCYQAHIQLVNSFHELLISLKRRNFEIDQELSLCHRQILLELSLDIYSGREEITFLMSQTSSDLVPDCWGEKLPLSLEPTLERVCYLNREKEGNEYFIDYITSMQTREDACIKIKNRYERYHRS